MDKNESNIIRGMARILMFWLHLFGSLELASCYTDWLYNDEYPMSLIISIGCTAVRYYVFLSGYGLYAVRQRGGVDKNRYSRVAKIFIHFWVILTIFLSIACILQPERFPGSWIELAKNYTAIWHTYNGTYWFIPLFVLLSAIAPILFHLLDKYGEKIMFFTLFITSLLTAYIAAEHTDIIGNGILYKVFNRFEMLFVFTCGAIARKCSLIEKSKQFFANKSFLALLSLVLVVYVRLFIFHHRVSDCVFCLLVIVLFLNCKRWAWLDKIFVLIGRHSLNTWLIHYWFIILFTPYLHMLKYPLVVLVVFTAANIAVSHIINYITTPLDNYITKVLLVKQHTNLS